MCAFKGAVYGSVISYSTNSSQTHTVAFQRVPTPNAHSVIVTPMSVTSATAATPWTPTTHAWVSTDASQTTV